MDPTRRGFMGALLAMALGGAGPAAASGRVVLARLQPGVYVASAANAEVARANAGEVVPTLVHVTGAGVLVVDPGPHLAWGNGLLAAIGAVTPEPVRWVVNTHAHPENVLANAAFARLRPRPVFLASAATAGLMRQRCEACLARLAAQLGPAAMRGTRIVLPEPGLRHGDRLQTGATAWEVQVHAGAHSAADTVLYAPRRRYYAWAAWPTATAFRRCRRLPCKAGGARCAPCLRYPPISWWAPRRARRRKRWRPRWPTSTRWPAVLPPHWKQGAMRRACSARPPPSRTAIGAISLRAIP